jgi:VWFA-related protein
MFRTPSSRSFTALLAAAALLGALPGSSRPAAGQRIVQAEEPTFFEIVDVNVVNVEVFVTDERGRFVPGLTADDFTVLEDGKPVEVTNFYGAGAAAGPGAPATRRPAVAAGGPPPLLPSLAEDLPVPEEQRLFLVLFVDNQNLFPTDRNRLVRSIDSFLRKNPLRPEDRLILVSYDGPGSLRVHQPPTRDLTSVLASLQQISRGSSNGLNRSADRRHMLYQLEKAIAPPVVPDDLLEDMAEADAQATYAGIRLYAQSRLDETRRTAVAVGQFIDSLGGLPGRKALVYVSGGLSLRPAEALFQAWENKYGGDFNREHQIGTPNQDSFQFDATLVLSSLAERANANRVTLYALGATEELAANTSANPGSSVWGTAEESAESFNLAKSLHLLTGPTGGFAAVDAVSSEAALTRISQDFDSYYSIGYTPPPGRTSQYHRIEVRAKNPKLKVRHREAHRDRTVSQRMSDRTLSALFLGGGDNPLAVSLLFEDELEKKGNEYLVTLMVKFPMSSVVLLPKDQYHEGRVMVYLGARDTRGRTSGITQVVVPIRVPDAELLTALGQTVAYRANLLLKDGTYTVAVGVRDELGNVGSTVTAAYTPGRPTEAKAGR